MALALDETDGGGGFCLRDFVGAWADVLERVWFLGFLAPGDPAGFLGERQGWVVGAWAELVVGVAMRQLPLILRKHNIPTHSPPPPPILLPRIIRPWPRRPPPNHLPINRILLSKSKATGLIPSKSLESCYIFLARIKSVCSFTL